MDRFKEIVGASKKYIAERFAEERTRERQRAMDMVPNNCKSFLRIEKVSGAVVTLMPGMAQQNTASMQFAKELQECSMYYLLLGADLLTQVPKTSGRLSPANTDKAVKAMVYKTKSEQIDVITKNLIRLAGMTDEEFKAWRDPMFERIKHVMGRDWNTAALHARYKAFCEYVLSDGGGKARLRDLLQGNVCGGLYTCW